MKKILMGIFLIYVFPCTFLFASPPILFFEKRIKKTRKEYTLYKIKKGEYIYSILRRLKLPKTEFGEYIRKIKQLNPEIKDINKLYAGQIIKLPKIYTIRHCYRKCSKGDFINNLPQGVEIIIPSRNPKIKQITEHKETNSFNNITLCLLQKLGFTIYKKDIMIFPVKSGWIQIDTSKSPVLEDTEGKKIILVNDPIIYKRYKEVEDRDISVCFIKDLSIYESLLKIFSYTKNFKIWPNKQNLIITHNFFVAELKGDIQILKYSNLSNTKDISYYIFFLNKKNCTFTENLAYSFLLKYEIFVYFWCNKKKNFISCTDNVDKNIYVPKISANRNIKELKLNNLLENAKINITNSLTLYVPILKFKEKKHRPIYLLEYNEPELVAILRAKGYNCYIY